MQNTDILDRLPFELASILVTNKFFCDIPVVVVEKGNVKHEFDQAQAVIAEKTGKRGVAVLVLQIVADDMSSTLQFGPMLLRPAFQVIEAVELNNDESGTKKSARKIARKIRDVIKTQNLTGLIADMRTGKPCIEPVQLDKEFPKDAIVSYQVNFECLEIGLEQMTAVQIPSILGNAQNQILFASGTPGAQIWYTLDDSFPFNGDATVYPAGNGEGKPSTAQLFVAGQPVNIPAGGCYVRARAYIDGDNYIASGVQRLFVPNPNH